MWPWSLYSSTPPITGSVEGFNESTAIYEEAPSRCIRWDNTTIKFLAWESVPKGFKKIMKERVKNRIMGKNVNSPFTTALYIDGFMTVIKQTAQWSKEPTIVVLNKYAILEVINEEKLINRSFIIISHGHGWFIYFIQPAPALYLPPFAS